MHMAGGGGEGSCTCILCIPFGYAPGCGSLHFDADQYSDPESCGFGFGSGF